MQANLDFPKGNISHIVDRVLSSRRLTRADQQQFMMAMLASDSVDHAERSRINQVFDALQRGFLKIVD